MKRAPLRQIFLCTASSSTLSSAFVSNTSRLQKVASHQIHSSSTKIMAATKNLVIDPFCFRQFKENDSSAGYQGTVFNISMEKFEQIVNERFDSSNLQDGYAPFCKHIFVENDFTDARVCVLPITKENEHCLRSKYEARSEKELPVLSRYFDKELLLEGKEESEVFPVAKYLDLILYSREQIIKENAAMGKESTEGEEEAAPWGIVSIKAQDINKELPMTPITAMRNALGREHGGSGVPIDREKYMEAFEYW
eukprot:CAMPEP_0201721902 /NCGR_PEP_ID=MMETSP0593-20130828/6432_1 /ASSEMBLY_ACC=CAM_ASM_000672 /TAXON_ID=267983 /ORGANISM="Skeletonema japonicum, Strain CCMP2506" /LENGTH=251 /DNA_ID=CAMNT_0048212779 /DNA_START=45 /DNA_END=797 /DNA_ORIENTATION=+